MNIVNMHKVTLLLMCLLFALGASAQNRQLSGTVVSHNEPLPGVTIMVKGTAVGVASDLDGKFSISVNKGNTLVFSMIGYKSQEILIENTTEHLSVNMEEDIAALEEVVVIGYGSVRKEDLTGSVVAIKAEELNRAAVTSPQELLQSKVPGLLVMPGNGQPGAKATLRIRSGASLNASNDPLIVIDGVPVSNDAAPGMSNPLATINPDDIESFTVLKDASATAIYGSRASNGVIIIQTKKGAKTKAVNVSYSSTYSLSDPHDRIEVLGEKEYRQLMTEIYSGTNNAEAVNNILNQYEGGTEWQDEIFRTAFSTDQNVSLSGTAFNVPYRVSFGYTNEDGTLKTSNYERYTAGINLSPKFFDDHLSVDIHVKATVNQNDFADEGAVGTAAFYDPTKPKYNTDGKFNGFWNWTADGQALNDAAVNPLSLLYDVRNDGKTRRSIGNIQLDYKFHFLPELRANLNMGYDVAKGKGWNGALANSFQAAKDTDFRNVGQHEEWNNFRRNQLLEFYLNYVKDIKDFHLDAMAGYSWQHFYQSDYTKHLSNTIDEGYDKEGWTYNDARKAFEKDGCYSVPTENYLVSFFGRLNLSYKNRYLITATLRNDGSSKFSEDNRWGLFPSVAGAWTITNEKFMENATNVLSTLKLRAGYGVTGQQDIKDNYSYIPSYVFGSNAVTQYMGTLLLKPNGYNQNLKWEETATTNFGIDYGFFNNRIYGSIEYYFKKTSDLLNTVDVAAGTNFTNQITANVGTMENKGLEFNVNALVVSKNDFTWDLGFNMTWNESKITKLTTSADANIQGISTGGISAGTGSTIQKHMVGYAPNTFYCYQQVYDENGKPIQNVFVDRNKDGQITEGDRYLKHKPAPDVYFGFNSQFKYKNWDLGFNMHGSLGNYVFNDFLSNNGTMYSGYDAVTGTLRNRLAKAAAHNFRTSNITAQYFSDLYLENASFLKMDNITLGYSFDKVLNTKISGRISASVKNVFTITDYSGLDPETADSERLGIDHTIWPRPQVYTLGLNLNF